MAPHRSSCTSSHTLCIQSGKHKIPLRIKWKWHPRATFSYPVSVGVSTDSCFSHHRNGRDQGTWNIVSEPSVYLIMQDHHIHMWLSVSHFQPHSVDPSRSTKKSGFCPFSTCYAALNTNWSKSSLWKRWINWYTWKLTLRANTSHDVMFYWCCMTT